jgi:hypothetical protein
MNATMKVAGAAAAACAACCAVSILPALFASASLVAIGVALSTWGLAIAALALAIAGLYFLARRKAAPNADFQSLKAIDGCGCSRSCGASTGDQAAIACTLDAGEFKQPKGS